MKKASEKDMEKIRKEIEVEIKLTCITLAILFMGVLIINII